MEYLRTTITTAIQRGSFGRDVNTALITLILKKDKDPTNCGNYRPLSLLNADIKLFSKTLAGRLEVYLPKLIHPDQSGFVKKRLSADNLRRLLHILDSSDSLSSKAILSVDAEKAFDRLEWSFLWSVLRHMGLGSNFVNMIKTIYANPSASVVTGNIHSPPFKLSRSSRQGDPISSMLFILSLEPLAQSLRLSTNITPIKIKSTLHHISLFADDVLLFFSDIKYSLPNILSKFEQFSYVSSYKINWSKSSLLPLNSVSKEECTEFNIPVVSHFKYLGVNVFASLEKTITKNYNNTLSMVKKDLERWQKLPIYSCLVEFQ